MKTWTRKDITIYCADSLDVIEEIIDRHGTFHCCITDPPYELNFMNQKWDSTGISFDVKTWQKILMALKPGGALLSFGGSRTFYGIGYAIEKAGFLIRDTIIWAYGSGFPKGLNISQEIDEKLGCEKEIAGFKSKSFKDSNCWGTPNSSVDNKGFGSGKVYGDSSCEFNTSKNPYHVPVSDEAMKWLGWNTILKPAFEPIILAMKPMESITSEQLFELGYQFWFNEKKNIVNSKKKTFFDGLLKSEKKEQERVSNRTVTRISLDPECNDEKIVYNLETGEVLEKIIIGPYKSRRFLNFVANTLVHGVSGMNIDECRIQIKGDEELGGGGYANGEWQKMNIFGKYRRLNKENFVPPSGRWPANLILSHHEDCVFVTFKIEKRPILFRNSDGGGNVYDFKSLKTGGKKIAEEEVINEIWECHEDCPVKIINDQSAEYGSGSGKIKYTYGARTKESIALAKKGMNVPGRPVGGIRDWGDRGGPSRFFSVFYHSKAGASERDSGLHHERNTHPTVKPVDVMRYLVRLVTPHDGIVLDPFMGSGSTGVACILEDREFVGIELNEKNFELARKRLDGGISEQKQTVSIKTFGKGGEMTIE